MSVLQSKEQERLDSIQEEVMQIQNRYQKEIDRLEKENKDLRKQLILKEQRTGNRKRRMKVSNSLRLNTCTCIHNCDFQIGEHSGSVVERRTPEQEVGGSKPTSTLLCP